MGRAGGTDDLERIARLERELRELRASLAAVDGAPFVEVLLLEAGEAAVAIPLTDVVQVVPRVMLFRLPGAADWQAGYMRWRGEQVSVVDLCARWSGKPLPLRLEDRIVVVRHGDRLHGLLVADVVGVDRLTRDETCPVSPDGPGADYALGIATRAGRSLLLVSLERLLAGPSGSPTGA